MQSARARALISQSEVKIFEFGLFRGDYEEMRRGRLKRTAASVSKIRKYNNAPLVWKSLMILNTIQSFVCAYTSIRRTRYRADIYRSRLVCVNTLAFRIRGVSVRRPRFPRVQHSLSRWLLLALGLLNATQRPNKLPPSAATVRETVCPTGPPPPWTAIAHAIIRK